MAKKTVLCVCARKGVVFKKNILWSKWTAGEIYLKSIHKIRYNF